MPPEERDKRLIVLARDGALATIVNKEVESDRNGAATHAIALRAHLDSIGSLSAAEKSLMREWLDRLADS